MELHEAIKTIVDTFGKDIIDEKRFLNAIADYYSFRDNPAGKMVLTAMVNGGYLNRFLGNPSESELTIIISQIENEVYNNYGFRREVVDNILNSIIRGLNLTIPIAPRNDKTSTHAKETPTIHTQIASKDLSYSENYIMSLYPILFENVPHHAHMDFDIFQKKLQMDSDEAFQLFKFLKGMGVYIYNVNSDDYDMKVDSEDTLRKLYRDYIIQKRILNIPLSNGETLDRINLEVIIRILYNKKCISVERIDSELSSIHEHKWFAKELFDILRRLNFIDKLGRSLNPYLTPEYMANCIVNHVVCLNKNTLEEGIGFPKNKASLFTIKPLTPYEYLLTEEYIVSLYSPLFSRYAHIDAQRIQDKLNIKDEEVYSLIRLLEKIKALRYNRYSQDYDICVYSEDGLQKLYRDWKNEEITKTKPHLFSLQRMEKGLEHLLKLKFTNVALLVKNLQTDDNKAAVVFQELIQTKIINDKGALINPYLGVKAIAKKIWRKC